MVATNQGGRPARLYIAWYATFCILKAGLELSQPHIAPASKHSYAHLQHDPHTCQCATGVQQLLVLEESEADLAVVVVLHLHDVTNQRLAF